MSRRAQGAPAWFAIIKDDLVQLGLAPRFCAALFRFNESGL